MTGAAMAMVTKKVSTNTPGPAVGWRKNRRPGAVARTRRRSAATTASASTAAPPTASQFQIFRGLPLLPAPGSVGRPRHTRSEEHTSELQSHSDLVCRLLLEKKKEH